MWPPYCFQTIFYYPWFLNLSMTSHHLPNEEQLLSRMEGPLWSASACLSGSSLIKLLIACSTLVISNYRGTVLSCFHFQSALYIKNVFPKTSPTSHLTLVCLENSYSSFWTHSPLLQALFWSFPLDLRPLSSFMATNHFTEIVSFHIWHPYPIKFYFLIWNFTSADILPV